MTRRARSEEAKDRRRQVILEAALNEFFESGFSASRMDDIATRAGFSKGTLYLYFDSKEELFVTLLQSLAIPNVERLEAVAETNLDVASALRALLTVAAHMVRESPLPRALKVMLAESGAFPEVIQTYREKVIDRVLAALARVLERAHDRGELVVDDPQLTARLVAAPIIFSAIWRVVFEQGEHDRVDLDALFALHAETLLHGLRDRAETTA